MTVTKAWKVYGRDGHRQALSFEKSFEYDFSVPSDEGHTNPYTGVFHSDKVRLIKVLNSDKTGTNNYSIVVITKCSEEDVYDEFYGQLSDGIFENYNVGRVEDISLEEIENMKN